MEKSKVMRMDNVGLVVKDLDAAKEFFTELGLELDGEQVVEGELVDGVVGIKGARSKVAFMRTPDGHSKIELTQFLNPESVAGTPGEQQNTLGKVRVMFTVTDLREVLARLEAKGGRLVKDVVDYMGVYRLCYVLGPDDFTVALAQPLKNDEYR